MSRRIVSTYDSIIFGSEWHPLPHNRSKLRDVIVALETMDSSIVEQIYNFSFVSIDYFLKILTICRSDYLLKFIQNKIAFDELQLSDIVELQMLAKQVNI